MIKKIVHTADLHIRTFKMHDEYKIAFNLFLDKVRKELEGIDYKEARIVIVGDLVHQKITISNEQYMLLSWLLDECSKICPVILVAGNHDLLENNKDRVDSITPIVDQINRYNKNVMYLKERKCYRDDDIVWTNYSIFEENRRPDIEEHQEKYGNDNTYVGLFHAPVVGASTDLGFEFESATPLEHFKGCDMVLLGDIHKRQSFEIDGIPMAYPSSLIQQNYGESVSKHGFLLWDVETRTFEEHDISIPYGWYQFKITSLDDLEEDKEILMNK